MSNMSSTSIPVNGLDLTPTLGPLYWGFLMSLVLTGINIVQGYIYFPSGDRTTVQAVAASMLVLNIASSALVAQSVYYYTVPHYGSLLPFNSITSELSAECLISTAITLISQGYFVLQIYGVIRLRKQSWVIPGLVGILAVLAFVFGAACTTVMIVHNHAVLADRSQTFSIFFGLAKGFGAVTDIVATLAMCMLLSSARTGMTGTNSVIKGLIQYIVHRGVLVTLIQTLLLITFHAAPTHLYWLAFHVNVTKLYANTFFAMLNGRENLQRTTHNALSFGSRESKRQYNISNSANHSGSAQDEIEMGVGHSDSKGYTITPMPTITKTVVIAEFINPRGTLYYFTNRI